MFRVGVAHPAAIHFEGDNPLLVLEHLEVVVVLVGEEGGLPSFGFLGKGCFNFIVLELFWRGLLER